MILHQAHMNVVRWQLLYFALKEKEDSEFNHLGRILGTLIPPPLTEEQKQEIEKLKAFLPKDEKRERFVPLAAYIQPTMYGKLAGLVEDRDEFEVEDEEFEKQVQEFKPRVLKRKDVQGIELNPNEIEQVLKSELLYGISENNPKIEKSKIEMKK